MDERQKEMVHCARHALLSLNELKCDLTRELVYAKEDGSSYADYENYIQHLECIDAQVRCLFEVSRLIAGPKLGRQTKEYIPIEIDDGDTVILAWDWPPEEDLPSWGEFLNQTGLVKHLNVATKCALVSWSSTPGSTVTFFYPHGAVDDICKRSIENLFTVVLNRHGYLCKAELEYGKVKLKTGEKHGR